MSPDSKATHLTSSVIAGGIAAVFSQPVDLIKNRYIMDYYYYQLSFPFNMLKQTQHSAYYINL